MAIAAEDLPASTTANGTNGHAGAEVIAFKRGSDTDEDGPLVGWASVGTLSTDDVDDTDLFTGLADTTAYATYARWRYYGPNGKVHTGPWSARNVVTTT